LRKLFSRLVGTKNALVNAVNSRLEQKIFCFHFIFVLHT